MALERLWVQEVIPEEDREVGNVMEDKGGEDGKETLAAILIVLERVDHNVCDWVTV